jgi:hypothetical protein
MIVFSLLLDSSTTAHSTGISLVTSFGGFSVDGERRSAGVFDDFGVALALLVLGFRASDDVVGVFAVVVEPLGVRLRLDFVALLGAIGGFSTK